MVGERSHPHGGVCQAGHPARGGDLLRLQLLSVQHGPGPGVQVRGEGVSWRDRRQGQGFPHHTERRRGEQLINVNATDPARVFFWTKITNSMSKLYKFVPIVYRYGIRPNSTFAKKKNREKKLEEFSLIIADSG